MNEEEALSSFWTHADELRRTLLHVLAIIGLSALICFACYEPIISFLTHPSQQFLSTQEERLEYARIHNPSSLPQIIELPANSLLSTELSSLMDPISPTQVRLQSGGYLVYLKPIANPSGHLVILSPTEGFVTAFKVCALIGAALSSPLWLFAFIRFLIPGLHSREKRLIIPFILTSILFMSLGGLFAFHVTIPLTNQYLTAFNDSIGTNLWSLSHYLNYTLFLMMANAIAFELGAIGIFAVRLKQISAASLIEKRRFAVLGAFILAAILTPPDVLSQLLLAIPLIGLYEALILYARLQERLINEQFNE